jgi:hypothetical protein
MPSEDVLADFAHQLRQPLSVLEALTFYLDLITSPADAQVHEQLQKVHSEIANADRTCARECAFFTTVVRRPSRRPRGDGS